MQALRALSLEAKQGSSLTENVKSILVSSLTGGRIAVVAWVCLEALNRRMFPQSFDVYW